MKIIDLNGKWLFANKADNVFFEGIVPGTNYSDLLRHGKIENPFIKEKDTFWVYNTDWIYKRSFTVEKCIFDCKHVNLVMKKMDTLFKVFINSKMVFEGSNVHLQYVVDILQYLQCGENEILVEFASPVKYIAEKQKIAKMPNNSNGITGVSLIRKAQCHFGWDWGPIIPVSGILEDIYIEACDYKINQLLIKQLHNNDEIELAIEVINDNKELSGNRDGIFSEVSIIYPNNEIKNFSVPIIDSFKITHKIENPELWWTYELNSTDKQPLYSITAKIIKKCNTECCQAEYNVTNEKSTTSNVENLTTELYSITKKIGLRTIKLKREEDEYGNQFQFILNGVPLFIKGANWIPADSLPDRVTFDVYKRLISDVRNSNMNMIRIWGGGFYGHDILYDLCDELGILVWQDFCFACNPYEFFDDEFLSSIKEEAIQNINRLKHRASLAIWCGNNEMEAMSTIWTKKQKDSMEFYFYKELPKIVSELDEDTPYIPGSPVGNEFLKGVSSDNEGDTHLWQVWHGLMPLNYYRKRMTRFCSEYGLEALPDMKTIKTFATPEEYSLKSDAFMAHQKCSSGNNKMLYYIATKFRIPSKFEDLVYLSQLVQNECVMDASYHWRRNRGRCNGSIYWQLNDCWPVTSWASIDYYGRYKALQYNAKHFFAPQALSLLINKYDVSFFVLNDKKEDFHGVINYYIESFDGEILDRGALKGDAQKLKSTFVKTLSFSHIIENKQDNVYIYAELKNSNGEIISTQSQLFTMEKNITFPTATLSIKNITVNDNVAKFTITSNMYARYVFISIENEDNPLSDNYFHLRKNEKKIITVNLNNIKSKEDLEKNISLKSLCDIISKRGKLYDFIVRQSIKFLPSNFINLLAYKFFM